MICGKIVIIINVIIKNKRKGNNMSLLERADSFWRDINLEDVSLVGTILNSKETYNPDIVDRVRKIMKGNKQWL